MTPDPTATAASKLVFNAKKWNEARGDVGDNSQFWEVATPGSPHFSRSGELVADVTWADGSITKGHFIDCMREV